MDRTKTTFFSSTTAVRSFYYSWKDRRTNWFSFDLSIVTSFRSVNLPRRIKKNIPRMLPLLHLSVSRMISGSSSEKERLNSVSDSNPPFISTERFEYPILGKFAPRTVGNMAKLGPQKPKSRIRLRPNYYLSNSRIFQIKLFRKHAVLCTSERTRELGQEEPPESI